MGGYKQTKHCSLFSKCFFFLFLLLKQNSPYLVYWPLSCNDIDMCDHNKANKDLVKLVGLCRAERAKVMLARFSECMKRHTIRQICAPVSVIARALYALTLVCKQPICQIPSPQFLPRLAPTEDRERERKNKVNSVGHTRKVSSSLVPSLGDTGSCFLNQLPWRTWGGTASSPLTLRAQLIWPQNRGRHGQIHPEETNRNKSLGLRWLCCFIYVVYIFIIYNLQSMGQI